jgi:hypothetical protein
MKSLLNVRNIIILGLLGILIFSRYTNCAGKNQQTKIIKVAGKSYEVIKHEIDTLEIIKKIFIDKPGKDIYHDTTIYVQIPMSIDTLAIIRDYFAKNVYNDTLKLDDSLGFVFIRDTISQNKIAHRTFTANIKERLVNEKIYLKEPAKRQLYYGFEGTFDKIELFKGVGGGLLYKTKSDKIYKFNLGVMSNQNDINPYANFGMYWKIKLKQ